jgi:hypothetical protein
MGNQQPEHCSHAFIGTYGNDRPADNFSSDASFFQARESGGGAVACNSTSPAVAMFCQLLQINPAQSH